ncbi:MAG: hypothetical protein Aureis2KO_08350 [Aureisphaera sp.]
MKKEFYRILTMFFVIILVWSCKTEKKSDNPNPDQLKIEQLHSLYVNGWLENDEEKVMGLLEENARIQPNRLKPIEGKSEIRKFWFPKDSSKTIINDYQTEIINIKIMDTLAISTHTSLLDWTYRKDTVTFGMVQNGFNTTIYRKQSDNSWKIWRSMWTDIYSKGK